MWNWTTLTVCEHLVCAVHGLTNQQQHDRNVPSSKKYFRNVLMASGTLQILMLNSDLSVVVFCRPSSLQSCSDVAFCRPSTDAQRTISKRAAAVIIWWVRRSRKERLTFGSCWSGRRGDFCSPSAGLRRATETGGMMGLKRKAGDGIMGAWQLRISSALNK